MSEAEFGRWLRARREERNLTRKDLARRIGCSIVTVEKIEGGTRRPSAQIAELLADWLDTPTSERLAFVQIARGRDRVAGDPGARARPPSERSRSNLPAPVTAFVGRRALVAETAARLRVPGVRLLSLTGSPGIGKTRLSLQI